MTTVPPPSSRAADMLRPDMNRRGPFWTAELVTRVLVEMGSAMAFHAPTTSSLRRAGHVDRMPGSNPAARCASRSWRRSRRCSAPCRRGRRRSGTRPSRPTIGATPRPTGTHPWRQGLLPAHEGPGMEKSWIPGLSSIGSTSQRLRRCPRRGSTSPHRSSRSSQVLGFCSTRRST